MQFQDKLKQLIDDHNITRKELADQLNVAYSTVGNYINAGREPDIDMLIKIADCFSISVDELVGHSTSNSISDDEIRLLRLFRQLAPENRELLIKIAAVMGEQHNSKQVRTSQNVRTCFLLRSDYRLIFRVSQFKICTRLITIPVNPITPVSNTSIVDMTFPVRL